MAKTRMVQNWWLKNGSTNEDDQRCTQMGSGELQPDGKKPQPIEG